jgi:hypothetical protein
MIYIPKKREESSTSDCWSGAHLKGLSIPGTCDKEITLYVKKEKKRQRLTFCFPEESILLFSDEEDALLLELV